jgi:hypothetical protein
MLQILFRAYPAIGAHAAHECQALRNLCGLLVVGGMGMGQLRFGPACGRLSVVVIVAVAPVVWEPITCCVAH